MFLRATIIITWQSTVIYVDSKTVVIVVLYGLGNIVRWALGGLLMCEKTLGWAEGLLLGKYCRVSPGESLTYTLLLY